MKNFNVTILGCGSALPTLRHLPSAQIVEVGDKFYLVDCGEGTQLQFMRLKIKQRRMNRIFISHFHGDHCFGLPGLISTLSLLGRKEDLFIYGPENLEGFLASTLMMFDRNSFAIHFKAIDAEKHELIVEDNVVSVYSIPLKHRIPTCGFLFVEKTGYNHLLRDKADFYGIPMNMYFSIKKGADFVLPDGTVIPNRELTVPPAPARKYAYCSDTAFYPELAQMIEGAELLFHEATYAHADIERAVNTYHSTAVQAAEMAVMANVKKLVIGHFSSRYSNDRFLGKEAMAVFPNTVVADEGMKIDV
ncbi:MAG: ribonuclease Z [Tannerellaceae bacterium]|jgi:ribonuclease Z|nr:ribonuclease Z [Tannerellaceae bacterium]